MPNFRENFSQFSVTLKLTILGGLAIASYILITSIAVPTLSKFFNAPLLEYFSGNIDTSIPILRSLQWLQLLSTLALFALPSLLFIDWRDGNYSRIFPKISSGEITYWIAGIILLPLWAPIGEYFTALLHLWAQEADLDWLNQMRFQENAQAELITAFIQLPQAWDVAVNTTILVILPALCEELFFRASIQQTLMEKNNPWKAIAISAVLFGILHFQLLNLPMLIFFGMLLGIIYHKTNNLWVPILAHLMNNGITLYYAYQAEEYTNQVDELLFNTTLIVPSTVGGILVLVYLLRRK